MIEEQIEEDLSDKTGYKVKIGELPPDIKEEIQDLKKSLKKILIIKNRISEENRKKFSFRKKQNILEYKNELKNIEEEYEKKLEDISKKVIKHFKRVFEAKEGVTKNIVIDSSYIEKVINTKTQKFSCPYCGAPLNLEEGKDVVVCSYCGGTINLKNLNILDSIIKDY